MHVLGTVAQRSPGLPVGPHPLHSPRLRRLACLSARQSARMAHDGRLQRACPRMVACQNAAAAPGAVRTSLSMQSVHEQLVQRETGPEWTAAARVPPLQQPAPASGRAC